MRTLFTEGAKRHWKYVLTGALLFVLGGLAGWYIGQTRTAANFSITREPGGQGQLIDPLLYTNAPESAAFPRYTELKAALAAAVVSATNAGKASDVSVYYRDLDTNQWVGINNDHTFALASLLKVATALAVFRHAEEDPSVLTASITLAPTVKLTASQQDYMPPTHPLSLGTPYTISDLVWHQLIESDNDAEDALEAYLGQDEIRGVFQELSIPIPTNASDDAIDTAPEYSRLFRVLYSATYLTRNDSETLLNLLSQSAYRDGLVAGVPPGTKVAHKFGEAVLPQAVELHDCGIVYYPGHPYFLCVLTRGSDFSTLAGVIQQISALTWQKVSAVYPTA